MPTVTKREKMTTMKLWMRLASTAQQEDLAQRAGTSRAYLYHLAGGFREASPELAQRIEQASFAMHRETRRKLPKVYRTDLNSGCKACEYAARCLGPAAIASEFDYVIEESSSRARRE